MKKLLVCLLTFMLLLTLGSCKKEEPIVSLPVEETQEVTDKKEEVIEVVKQEEIVEDTKDESKKEIDSEILKTYKYWVVFFNEDGSEIQREAIKWGTIPTYWSDTPYYEDGEHWYKFVGWKDRWGRDVKEFKPITGNTRFYAKYEIGGNIYHGGGSPAEDPYHVQISSLTSVPGAYINSKVLAGDNMEFIFDAKMTNADWCRCFGYWANQTNALGFQSNSSNKLQYYYGNGYGLIDYSGTLNQKRTYDVKYNGSNSFVKIDGTKLADFTTGSMDTTKELAIFSLTYSDVASGNDKVPLTMYYMKIYKDGSLVRDYIPVKILKEIDQSKNAADPSANIPVGTLCFYDKVEKMYYPSSGSKTFSDNPDHLLVECLTTSGTGGPYINTLLKVNDNMRFVFDAKAKSGVWTFMLGGYTAYVNGIALHPYFSPQNYEAYIGNHANGPLVDPTAGIDARSSYDFQVKSGNSYLIINGVTEYSDSLAVSGVTPQDLYIFAENNQQNHKANLDGALTIYNMKIYQNDILVRDYIPVYTTTVIDKTRNATNSSADIPVETYCMYDKLNDKYYTNVGGGAFTATPIN